MPFIDNATGAFLVPGSAGASAYDAWLALGNTGSLADFIAAQKGAPGADSTVPGPPGRQGDPGAGTMLSAVRSAAVQPSTFVVRLPDGACVGADPTNMAHQGLVVGLDVVGGPIGSVAQIVAIGPTPGVSGAFSTGDALWIGDGTTGRLGAPVNVRPTPPNGGQVWAQSVGTAAASGTINILLGRAVTFTAGETALVAPGSYAIVSALLQGLLSCQDAQSVATYLVTAIFDKLPPLPDDPANYPTAGGLFRNGDANGYSLTRIFPRN